MARGPAGRGLGDRRCHEAGAGPAQRRGDCQLAAVVRGARRAGPDRSLVKLHVPGRTSTIAVTTAIRPAAIHSVVPTPMAPETGPQMARPSGLNASEPNQS